MEISTKGVLTLKEAVEYVGMSEGHLYRLTSQKQIPFYKPRKGRIYFKREELEAWLCQNPTKTAK